MLNYFFPTINHLNNHMLLYLNTSLKTICSPSSFGIIAQSFAWNNLHLISRYCSFSRFIFYNPYKFLKTSLFVSITHKALAILFLFHKFYHLYFDVTIIQLIRIYQATLFLSIFFEHIFFIFFHKVHNNSLTVLISL